MGLWLASRWFVLAVLFLTLVGWIFLLLMTTVFFFDVGVGIWLLVVRWRILWSGAALLTGLLAWR